MAIGSTPRNHPSTKANDCQHRHITFHMSSLFFYPEQYHTSASLVLRDGPEENPGRWDSQQKWTCPVCKINITRNRYILPVRRLQSLGPSKLRNSPYELDTQTINRAAKDYHHPQPPHLLLLHNHLSQDPPIELQLTQRQTSGNPWFSGTKRHSHRSSPLNQALTVRINISMPNHSIVILDRGRIAGGFAFLIHNSIQFSAITMPTLFQTRLWLHLVNVYSPSGTNTNIAHLVEENNGIIMGDFNVHRTLYCTRTQEQILES